MDITRDRTQPTLELEGVWFRFDATTRLRIASLNSPEYQKQNTEGIEELRRQAEGKDIKKEVARKHIRDTYSKTILLGWEGVTDDGKDVKYTPELGSKLLDTHPDVWEFVCEKSATHANFREKRTEEAKAALGE